MKSVWKAARLVRRHRLLIIDELGHLPIDGADMLLEIISRLVAEGPDVAADQAIGR